MFTNSRADIMSEIYTGKTSIKKIYTIQKWKSLIYEL